MEEVMERWIVLALVLASLGGACSTAGADDDEAEGVRGGAVSWDVRSRDVLEQQVAELRAVNGELLAENADLDRIIADLDAQLDEAEDRADDAEDAVAALSSMGADTSREDDIPEPVRQVEVAPVPPPPPPPPAPAAPTWYPGQCTTNPDRGDIVCSTSTGEYVCRGSASPMCGGSGYFRGHNGCDLYWDGSRRC